MSAGAPQLALACTMLTVGLIGLQARQTLSRGRGVPTGGLGRTRLRRGTRRTRQDAPSNTGSAAWCDGLARALRAGSTLGRALVDVTPDHPTVGPVLAPALRAMKRGHPVVTALGAVERAPASLELPLAALRACAELGGPAAAPLERIAATLRTRAAIEEEYDAHSAQARLSARVLTVVPVAMLCLLTLTEPNVRAVLATPTGAAVLIAGSLFNAVGWLWMRHIVGVRA